MMSSVLRSLILHGLQTFLFFFTGLLAIPYAEALDIVAPVAEGLQNLVGENCPVYDSAKALQAFDLIYCHDKSTAMELQKKSLPLVQITKFVETNAENRYFSELAQQHSNELVCSSTFANQVATGDPEAAIELALKLEKLRLTKNALTDASSEVRNNPAIDVKVCPLNETDLKTDFPKELRKKNPSYAACLDVIATRAAYNNVLAEIPLSKTPALQTLLLKYQNLSSAPPASEVQSLIRKAYKEAEGQLLSQARELKTRATTKGGGDFNREEKRSLLSNPLVVEKIFSATGGTADFKALACSAEARYGKGADRLDEALFFGTFAVSGASLLTAKVGLKALQFLRVSNAAEKVGSLQLAMRIASYSTTVTSAANELYRSCAPQGNSLQVKKTDAICTNAPTVQQLKEDSCIYSASIHAMSFGTTAMATRLSRIAAQSQKEWQALQDEALASVASNRKAALALSQQRKQLLENEAQGIPTLKWQSSKNPNELPKASQSMTPDKSGLRFDQRRSLKETAKKKESEINKLKAEAEERRRLEEFYEKQGLEGSTLTTAVQRHLEVEVLKAEGKISEKLPNTLQVTSDSLVRGGKGPFQSKAGDINLLTAEQFEGLPLGSKIFNYKTGKEFIVGIDDLADPAELTRKVGGKYLEYGFKVSP